MPGAIFANGEKLTLRTVEPEDYDFLHQYWMNPAIRRGFAWHSPRAQNQIADFIEESDRSVHFLLCCDGDPIGFLWLFRINDAGGHGEMGYWITPDEQGSGYATEAAELGVQYAFNERGLHRVMARVFEENDASRRVLEKVGFEKEGCLRDHHYTDGNYVDVHLFGLLEHER